MAQTMVCLLKVIKLKFKSFTPHRMPDTENHLMIKISLVNDS